MVAVEDFMNKKNVALIEAFYPGMEGANALAQSIFGIANRWGRMPYTVYHSNWTKHNSMLDHDVTHQRTYRYGADAVVPFGFGLSLSTFRLAFASAPTATLPLAYGSDGAVLETVEVEIRNLGPLVGDEVVMAYFHPKKVGLTMYPTKSLFDFQRVKNLQPAARITISFTITEKLGKAKVFFHISSIFHDMADASMMEALATSNDWRIRYENFLRLRELGPKVIAEQAEALEGGCCHWAASATEGFPRLAQVN
eukprot:g32633.t1